MRPRDSQRLKVLAAQEQLRRAPLNTKSGTALRTAHEIRRSRWWQNRARARYGQIPRFRAVSWTAKFCMPVQRAWYSEWCLSLPTPAPIDGVHALAHMIQPEDSALHGPEFCRLFLDMTSRFISPAAGDQLRREFVAHKVKTRAVTEKTKFRRASRQAVALLADLEGEP